MPVNLGQIPIYGGDPKWIRLRLKDMDLTASEFVSQIRRRGKDTDKLGSFAVSKSLVSGDTIVDLRLNGDSSPALADGQTRFSVREATFDVQAYDAQGRAQQTIAFGTLIPQVDTTRGDGGVAGSSTSPSGATILEYTLSPAADSYEVISTTEIGQPGPPGERGSSATPGTTISEPFIDADGRVSFTFETHFGITSAGEPYYEPNPDNVPEDERAVYDPYSGTLSLGGPGRIEPAWVRIQGEWGPFKHFYKNGLVTHENILYYVTQDFFSGQIFSPTYLARLVEGVEAA